jgi:Fe-S cluster biogenesis protein NfuA
MAETFDELAARVDGLLDAVAHTDPASRDLLRETLDAITDFNRRGIAVLVQLLRQDPQAAEVLYRAVEEPEVMALFVKHRIIRSDRTLDVATVMEQIRPYLIAGSIDASVEEVRDDIAYVRFPNGCSAPDQQTKDEILGLIRQRVPGLKDAVELPTSNSSAFIALDTLRVGPA